MQVSAQNITRLLSFHFLEHKLSNGVKVTAVQFAPRYYTKSSLTVNEMNSYLRTDNVQTIETKTISNVNQFDRLRIKSPFNLNIHPLNPRDYPKMNKVFLTIYGDSNLGFSKIQWNQMFKFDIDYDQKEATLNIMSSFTDLGIQKILNEYAQTLECHLEVPFQSGISVKCLTNNNVSVENIETKDIFIDTKKGECLLNNIKATSVVVHSESGNIKCLGSVHGNVDFITSACGTINANKVLGSFLKFSVENNDVNIKTLYAENFKVKAKKSNIKIENAKGRGTVVNEDGKISIDSMDGQLTVNSDKGSANLFFSVLDKNSCVKTKTGDVNVSLMENTHASIELSCKKLSGHEDIISKLEQAKQKDGTITAKGCLTPGKAGDASLNIVAPKGKVKIDIRDWFSTLKLLKAK